MRYKNGALSARRQPYLLPTVLRRLFQAQKVAPRDLAAFPLVFSGEGLPLKELECNYIKGL